MAPKPFTIRPNIGERRDITREEWKRITGYCRIAENIVAKNFPLDGIDRVCSDLAIYGAAIIRVKP